MPAWWRRKCKSSISSRPKSARDAPLVVARAKSFGDVGGILPSPAGFDVEQRTGHPLPRPLASPEASGRVPTGAPCCSLSSAGSEGESPERGGNNNNNNHNSNSFRRNSGAESSWRGRISSPDSQRPFLFGCSFPDRKRTASVDASPRSEGQANGPGISTTTKGAHHAHQRVPLPLDAVSGPGPQSPGGRTAGVYPVGLRDSAALDIKAGRPDDPRSSRRHPLPRPPSSPLSPSSPSAAESKWKKGKPLGSGTFGHVYVGFNCESGQMCAIKEVEAIADDPNSKDCLKQLNQEINLLSQLSHPNIVQYLGSKLNNDTLAVYLEYISGGSLHKLVREYGPLKESVIRNYLRQILSGLAYLHGRNCIHRDIKGANILVGTNGDIKLADFGMAKHISSCASLCSFRGSPFWMAPEVVMHSNGYTLAVDIWSLGCTIIEMATAKPPWSQYTGVQAIFKIGDSKEIPELPDHLSNDAKDFLMLCLQRNPSARPAAVQLMEHPFVRNSGNVKTPKPNILRNAQLPSDGTRSMTTLDFTYNHNICPTHDRECTVRPIAGCLLLHRNPSNVGLRTNMLVPASPCSSPLWQAGWPSGSCYPSSLRHTIQGDSRGCTEKVLNTSRRWRSPHADTWIIGQRSPRMAWDCAACDGDHSCCHSRRWRRSVYREISMIESQLQESS